MSLPLSTPETKDHDHIIVSTETLLPIRPKLIPSILHCIDMISMSSGCILVVHQNVQNIVEK